VSFINACKGCIEKQRENDSLRQENESLKARVRYLEDKVNKLEQGSFGSSTPSSLIPFKENTKEEERKLRGCKKGHKGYGRRSIEDEEADRIEEVRVEIDTCPECGCKLVSKGIDDRTVIDMGEVKAEKIKYKIEKKYCPMCKKVMRGKVKGVLEKSLYGNQLIAIALWLYYSQRMPLNRVCDVLGISSSALVSILKGVDDLFSGVDDKLIKELRRARVIHADETGWRIDGKNGYMWLFGSKDVSIYRVEGTRSGRIVKEVLGEKKLKGVLVVDRYGGYNKSPCELQYCYEHLKREVEGLEEEFPDDEKVKVFVDNMRHLLIKAMQLRKEKISDEKYYKMAKGIKRMIEIEVNREVENVGIKGIQEIFRKNRDRLYKWVENREVPADNNESEREIRLGVISRKVSFGSQSVEGAKIRGRMMSIIYTMKKRGIDPVKRIKYALDELAKNRNKDPYKLLFHSKPPD